jgi:hypothetical protein
LPSHDNNSWYYPSQGHDSDEDNLSYGISRGNWGKKKAAGARWIRTGKLTAWGQGIEEWEVWTHFLLLGQRFCLNINEQHEERARNRMKLLSPREISSPPPVRLAHLRSPSPPVSAPYPPPATQHLSYSSFVLDQAVTHSFRSHLLDDLERATSGLIEGEAAMRRALGRLWQVMSEDPHHRPSDPALKTKREDEEEEEEGDEADQRLARAPDLTPPVHKLFLKPYINGAIPPSHFSHPEMQQESLEKSLACLRELQDDGREYVERLEEIREGLGNVRAQRNGVWEMIRERAVTELQEAASAYS